MQRLNQIDIIAELEKLKNKPVVPKERALIKAKKQGLEKTLDTFASKQQTDFIAYISNSLAIPEERRDPIKPLCKQIEDTYLFLDTLHQKKLVFLNPNISKAISNTINAANTMIVNRVNDGLILMADRLHLCKITLSTIAFMQTEFFEYNEKNKPYEINLSLLVPDLLQRYCELLIETQQHIEAKRLLRLAKEFLELWNIKLDTKFLGLFMTHYLLLTELDLKLGQLQKVLGHTLKAIDYYERSSTGTIISYKLPLILKECALLAYKNGTYSNAILFADLGLEQLEKTEVFVSTYEENSFKYMLEGLTADTKKWKIELVKDKKFLTFLVSESKRKLLEINKATLQSITENNANKLAIEYSSDNQFSIFIKEEHSHLPTLVKQLNHAAIICYLDPKSNKLVFDNLIDINMHSLKNILSRWFSQLETQKLAKLVNKKIENAEFVQVETHRYLPGTATSSNIAIESELKNEKKEKPVKTATTPSAPTMTENNRIAWGDNYPVYSKNEMGEVYKLYGQTAHNQYLFLNQGFFSQLNAENPDAARTLVNICGRGKVINNSQGNKGIIIEGKDVKIKDASKAYRFFGQVVATTTHKEKTCQLIEVNSWHIDPH